MANITFKGNPVETNGTLPPKGATAPKFKLIGGDLQEKSLADFPGKKILTINPSYDTGVCAKAAKAFNERAAEKDATILMISADLPFAQKRFCGAEGVDKITPLSSFRSTFSNDYGVTMLGGPLQGLTARAVLVLDENNVVLHSQLVGEIIDEPDYDAALAAL